MIPGTGLFDADVHFGRSQTERDFIFKSLEARLLIFGFSVVRMNYRGVSCNFINYPKRCKSCAPEKQFEELKERCIDRDVRSHVTPENMRDDFEQVFHWAKRQPGVNTENVIMFGHSEGTTHIARLIEQKRINPKGIVFMGDLTESLDTLIHWQIVGRMVENLMLMDQDMNLVVTNDEIKAAHSSNMLSIFPLASLLSPSGSWTESDFRSLLQTRYEETKKDALSQDDFSPYPSADFPQASYSWWKMFFIPDTPILAALSSFDGPVIYHNGSIDSQTNAKRQRDFISNYLGQKPKKLEFITHPQKGHTLGDDPLYGPISEDSMNKLVESFVKIRDGD